MILNGMILNKHTCCIKALTVFAFILFSTSAGLAQTPDNNDATPQPAESHDTTPDPPEPPGGTHVFGVLPNYRTVNASEVTGPLTARQKLSIARKDSFDVPLVLLAAALAGIGQWADQNPSYGQGMAGFGKRMAAGYADQSLGNLMTEGLFPAALREDPRYYRRGSGGTWSRTAYAFSRIFVTHKDSGRLSFNYAEWGGNSVATAISNAYYPDGRNVGANAAKLVEQCSIDGIGQVLKEFWPDIRERFFVRSKGPVPGH
jgi:hypothetical protein